MSGIVTKTYLGLKFSIFELNTLINEIHSIIITKKTKIIFGYSLTILPKFKTHPEFFYFSNKFDIFLSDGRGMYFLLKLLGFPLKSNISIPQLSLKLLTLADKYKYKVLLLGSDKSTNEIATANIRKNYPNAVVCPGINGYFTEDEESDIVSKINRQKPDILLIGISSPKKESFVNKWRKDLNVNIILPCGGVIDALAGKTKITSPFFKKIGMAWLYRFSQEPVRLFKPVLINGFSIIFFLIPRIFYEIKVKKNYNFSIPEYYGVSKYVNDSSF